MPDNHKKDYISTAQDQTSSLAPVNTSADNLETGYALCPRLVSPESTSSHINIEPKRFSSPAREVIKPNLSLISKLSGCEEKTWASGAQQSNSMIVLFEKEERVSASGSHKTFSDEKYIPAPTSEFTEGSGAVFADTELIARQEQEHIADQESTQQQPTQGDLGPLGSGETGYKGSLSEASIDVILERHYLRSRRSFYAKTWEMVSNEALKYQKAIKRMVLNRDLPDFIEDNKMVTKTVDVVIKRYDADIRKRAICKALTQIEEAVLPEAYRNTLRRMVLSVILPDFKEMDNALDPLAFAKLQYPRKSFGMRNFSWVKYLGQKLKGSSSRVHQPEKLSRMENLRIFARTTREDFCWLFTYKGLRTLFTLSVFLGAYLGSALYVLSHPDGLFTTVFFFVVGICYGAILLLMFAKSLAKWYTTLSGRTRSKCAMIEDYSNARAYGRVIKAFDISDRFLVAIFTALLEERLLVLIHMSALYTFSHCVFFLRSRNEFFFFLCACLGLEISKDNTGRRGVKGRVNGKHIWAFCDTGAGQNIIASQHARELGLKLEKRPTYLRMGNSMRVHSSGIVRYPWAFSDDPKNVTTIEAYVLDGFEYSLLLGNPFLQLTEMMTKNIHRFVKGVFPPQQIWTFNLLGDTSQRIEGLLGGSVLMQGLPDIGSSKNIMDGAWAKRKGFKILRGPEYCGRIIFPDRSTRNTIGQVHTTITLKSGKTKSIVFEVLPKCYVPVVLGEDFVFDNKLFTKYAGAMCDAKGSNNTRDLLCMDYQKQSWYDKIKTKLKPKKSVDAKHGEKRLGDKGELERQQEWDLQFQQGRKASEIEWQAEQKRRQSHESQQYPGWQPSGKISLIRFTPIIGLAGGNASTAETKTSSIFVDDYQDCIPLDVDTLPKIPSS